MKGFIYQVFCNTTGQRYIGCTTTVIKTRMSTHISHYKLYLKGKYEKKIIFDILQYNNYILSLIEEIEIEEKSHLFQKEAWWQYTLMCINKPDIKTCRLKYHRNNPYLKYFYDNVGIEMKEVRKLSVKQWLEPWNNFLRKELIGFKGNKEEFINKQHEIKNKWQNMKMKKEKL